VPQRADGLRIRRTAPRVQRPHRCRAAPSPVQ
jgi:hypothetical protein